MVRLPNRSKRRNLPLTNFLEILKNYFFRIITYHPNHLANFIKTMRLIHATQKKRNLLYRKIPIIVKIDDVESFADIFIWKKLTIDLIACIIDVKWIFGDYFFGILVCILSQQDSLNIPFSLRCVYLNFVFEIWGFLCFSRRIDIEIAASYRRETLNWMERL